jgi:hypothetical protein
MLIGTAQRIATVTNELNINLENQLIKNVNTQKLLGIYIDNNLNAPFIYGIQIFI